jgi:hypothetical protein
LLYRILSSLLKVIYIDGYVDVTFYTVLTKVVCISLLIAVYRNEQYHIA